MMAGWNAEVMESNAYHKAEDWNDNHNASTEVHSDRVRVELRIDVFQNVTSMKEHQVDIEVSAIIGTETKIVKQVSSWIPAGLTWVRLKPSTADELSWDRAKARSLAGGIAISLVLDRLNIAYDIEELIERESVTNEVPRTGTMLG